MADLNDIFGLHFCLSSHFRLYQLFTYMFMHANFEHIFFNMFSLWMFGCVIERVWGAKRFLTYYLVCGIGAGLFQELAQFVNFYMIASSQISGFSMSMLAEVARQNATALASWTTVGASGAIYGILLAFGMLFPEQKIFIFPLPIPIKAKWFVIIFAAIELFSAYASSGDGVAHLAHLGGMVFGFFLIRYWKRHPESDLGFDEAGSLFAGMRRKWEDKNAGKSSTRTSSDFGRRESDWDYNARKQQEQEEVDRILDKIRKNGYDSLTADEKRRLFDQSNKK